MDSHGRFSREIEREFQRDPVTFREVPRRGSPGIPRDATSDVLGSRLILHGKNRTPRYATRCRQNLDRDLLEFCDFAADRQRRSYDMGWSANNMLPPFPAWSAENRRDTRHPSFSIYLPRR